MPKSEEGLLTPCELELMTIIWKLNKATVREVLAELPKGRELAYTSASTTIRILEQKGMLTSEAVGKAHVYSPKVKKKTYENRSLNHMIDKVFDGAPSNLVRQLVDKKKLSAQEIAEIKKIIEDL